MDDQSAALQGGRSKEVWCKDQTTVLRTPCRQLRCECVRVVSDDEVFLLRCVRVARAEPDKVLGCEIPCLSQQGKLRVLRRRYEFNCNELSLTWGNTNKHTHPKRLDGPNNQSLFSTGSFFSEVVTFNRDVFHLAVVAHHSETSRASLGLRGEENHL